MSLAKPLETTAALIISVLLLGVSETRAESRTNVILIMADDMGYEALACNGGTSYPTPTFDRLAKQGMRFTRCYSQPVCTPSRNKIMTGRSNARNYRDFGILDSREITFGTLMRDAGYRTAIAGKWQLTGSAGTREKSWGTFPDACGFEQSCMWAYERDLPKSDIQKYFAGYPEGIKPRTSRFWYPSIIQNGKYRPTTLNDFGPDIYSQFLMDFIETHRDEPFFVYFPMALTHNPFIPTPDSPDFSDAEKFQSKAKYFGDMICYTGVIIDRMLTQLDALGLAENTLVLFTADNGTNRSLVSRMGDQIIIGGKALPLDSGVHVPMLAWWKGKIQGGTVCEDLIEFSDFVPTIVEAGGAKLPTDRVIDGKSFLARLEGKPYQPRDAVIVHYDKNPPSPKPQFRRVRFASDGRYKLYLDGRFFDVQTDPEELHPVDQLSADLVGRRKVLQSALDKMPSWEPDNSFFKGQEDGETQKRRKRLKELLAS